MDYRTLSVIVIFGLGTSMDACPTRPAVVPGSVAPDLERGGGDRPLAVWALTARDCLACQDVARGLRAAQQMSDLELVVAVLGSNRGIVSSFLNAQRLRASEAYFSREEFRDVFGRAPPPFLFVSNGKTIVDAWVGRERVESAVRAGDSESEFIAAVRKAMGSAVSHRRVDHRSGKESPRQEARQGGPRNGWGASEGRAESSEAPAWGESPGNGAAGFSHQDFRDFPLGTPPIAADTEGAGWEVPFATQRLTVTRADMAFGTLSNESRIMWADRTPL